MPELSEASLIERWELTLYVAGMTPAAHRALRNLTAICDVYLEDRYAVTVVDLLVEPERAKRDQIVAVPTLVRTLPRPVRKILGDLSRKDQVLRGLELQGA